MAFSAVGLDGIHHTTLIVPTMIQTQRLRLPWCSWSLPTSSWCSSSLLTSTAYVILFCSASVYGIVDRIRGWIVHFDCAWKLPLISLAVSFSFSLWILTHCQWVTALCVSLRITRTHSSRVTGHKFPLFLLRVTVSSDDFNVDGLFFVFKLEKQAVHTVSYILSCCKMEQAAMIWWKLAVHIVAWNFCLVYLNSISL